jgi:hypothetical protein
MIRKYSGELEIDTDRGVIYFHLNRPEDVQELNTVTMLRICRLPTGMLESAVHIDITQPELISIN